MHFHVNGVSYRVESEGQGPALLLLHGFTGSRVTWEPYLSNWTRQFQVVRVDVIGHGESDAQRSARYTMDRATADLAEILDRLQISHAHVLGYSMGGRLALSFAEWYPDRVNTLLLESSSPGLKTDAERRARREQDEALADPDRKGRVGIIYLVLGKYSSVCQSGEPAGKSATGLAERAAVPTGPKGWPNSLRGMGTGAQPSWWGHLGKIQCPVLLITGELDGKFCRIAKEMNGQFAQCQWRVVPGAGHAVHLEVPRLFDTIVMEFLLDQEIP